MISLYGGLNHGKNVRLFKNAFIEQLTYVHPALPALLFIPVVIYCIFFNTDVPVSTVVGAAASGVLFWTLTEYTLHRFVFHFQATSKTGKYLTYLFHGIHHDDPEDARRLVMPPVVSIILCVAYYALYQALFTKFFGEETAMHWLNPFFGGFVLGYLCYDYIHFYVHHASPTTAVGKFLKQYHMLHHFVTPHARYGVSSPLWDIVIEATPFARLPQSRAQKKA